MRKKSRKKRLWAKTRTRRRSQSTTEQFVSPRSKTLKRSAGARPRVQSTAFKAWRDSRLADIKQEAIRQGWILERQYESSNGSRYILLRREETIKIRLSDHGIDYRRPTRPVRHREVASWSISIDWQSDWMSRMEKVTARMGMPVRKVKRGTMNASD